jgi:hypothetical protein
MSADNWTNCPACIERFNQKFGGKEKALAADYGSLPAIVWMARRRELDAEKREAFEKHGQQTVREDYQIGLQNGSTVFVVDYAAECIACGWTHRFGRSEPVLVLNLR